MFFYDKVTLMYSIDVKRKRIAGRLKQSGANGEVEFLPLKSDQMTWIFQRKTLPSGSFEDVHFSPDIPYRCYERIKATKRGESSVDLELLDSKFPPFNLTYRTWDAIRWMLNDSYEQLLRDSFPEDNV